MSTGLRARVNEFSQPHVLLQRLDEAGVRHGQDAVAEIGFRVGNPDPLHGTTATTFFCDTGAIHIIDVTGHPDGQQLPERVTVEGLTVAGPGYWKGTFRVSLNGSIHLEPIGEMTAAADPYAAFREQADLSLA